MELLKPLCAKCWLIADGALPHPDKSISLCQLIVPSKSKQPPAPISNKDRLNDYLEYAIEYPIHIEESKKSFGCMMEYLMDLASKYKSIYETNYTTLRKQLAVESKDDKKLNSRSRKAKEAFERLLNLKNYAPNKIALNRHYREVPKVRIILAEPPLLDQHVYLFISPSAHMVPFSVGPFGAEPMPSFEFGFYKGLYLDRIEILVLLRKWSHNYKYFDTNLEFFKTNPNVHAFRENFGELTRPVLDFLRVVGFIKETRHGYRSNASPAGKERKQRLIRAMQQGHTLPNIIDNWKTLIGGKPLGFSQIKSILKGTKKKRGFYSEK